MLFVIRLLVRVLRFLAQCCLMAVLSATVVAVLFTPFGLLVWLLTGEFFGLVLAWLIGGVLGAGAGFGHPFVEKFSDPAFLKSEEEGMGAYLVDLYIKSWVPGLSLLDAWAKKDFRRARPGRWKRGLVAAIAMGAMGALIAVMGSGGPPPRDMSRWQASLLLVGLFAGMGAIAGALTDSR